MEVHNTHHGSIKMPEVWSDRLQSSPTAKRRVRSMTDTPNTDDCWIYAGWKDKRGYGRVRSANTLYIAHRVSYEHHKGKIPAGLVIDHLCRVTSCINPDHLEAVTQKENNLRGVGVTAMKAKQTTCIRGHKLTLSNRGQRYCETCNNLWFSGFRVNKKVSMS